VLQESVQAARALPQLEATVTGLIRRITPRQMGKRRARAQDPQHGVQHPPRICPGTTAAVRPPTRTEHRLEHGPLRIGEVHAFEYDGNRESVHRASQTLGCQLEFHSYKVVGHVPLTVAD
jgi:hypothetical protein